MRLHQIAQEFAYSKNYEGLDEFDEETQDAATTLIKDEILVILRLLFHVSHM